MKTMIQSVAIVALTALSGSASAQCQINLNPNSQSIQPGTPVSLRVGSQLLTNVQYQWQRNGVNIPGATQPTLVIAPFETADAGDYRCRVVCSPPFNFVQFSNNATLSVRNDALGQDYAAFIQTMTATEIVRSAYAKNPNPRMIAVLAGLRRVAARNPNASSAQLTQFMQAFDLALSTANPGDTTLRRGFNFQAAVRFQATVAVPGLDTDVGADILADLGLDPQGGSSTRDRQMVAFQSAQILGFASSDEVARMLTDVFSGKDALGGFNNSLTEVAAAYVRSLGIEPYPTRAQLAANFPDVLSAIQAMPVGPEAFQAEKQAGFPTLRARVEQELATLRTFIQAKIDQIDSAEGAFPTLASTAAGSTNQQVVDAALAQRTTDLLAISRSRSVLSFSTQAMLQGNINEQQRGTQLRKFSNIQIQFADTTADTVSTALSGAGSILSGIGGILGAEGPAGIISGIGDLASGTSELLPLIMGDGNPPPAPEQQLANEIGNLRNQVEEFRVEMVDRFNRIDASLLATYDAVTTGFDAVNAQLQGINQSLSGVQQELATAQSNLSRFEQNLYGILADGFNIAFTSDANTAIGYRRRLGQDMSLAQFGGFEGTFYTYATDVCDDQGYAGTDLMPYDATALSQLGFNNANPIGFQINGLRQFPFLNLGQPRLGTQRLANPTSWSLNADTYAQLARENPWYFARLFSGDPGRLNNVFLVGNRAQTAMHAAKSQSLFDSLINDYTSRVALANTNVNTALSTYMTTAGIPLANLWGGPNQNIAITGAANTTMLHYNSTCALASCTKPSPRNGNAVVWDILPPAFKLASYLNLPNRQVGGTGNKYHFTYRVKDHGGAGTGFAPWNLDPSGQIYTATVDVELYWNPNNNALYGSTYSPGPNRGMTLVATRRFAFTMLPNTFGRVSDPLQSFEQRWTGTGTWAGQPILPMRDTFFDAQSLDRASGVFGSTTLNVPVWTATTIINQPALDAVTAEVNNALRGHQAAHFLQLANALGSGADIANVRASMDLATVNVKLIDAYLNLAAPDALRSSDLLRGGLRGYELGLDRAAFQQWFANMRAAILALPSGSAAATTRPTLSDEAARRLGIFRPELNAALAAGRPLEFHPFMKWTLASLNNLQARANKLAGDDSYATPTGQTLLVGAPGLLANDAQQPAAGVTAELVTPPSQGSLSLNPNGSFSFTPPAGFQGTITFTYRARGELNPPSTNVVFSDPATVSIRVGPCTAALVGQPQSVSITPGQSAAFVVSATAPARLSYQWRRAGVDLVDGTTPSGSNISGARSARLVILNAAQGDLGSYQCLVTTSCGSVSSAAATLTGPCTADVDDGSGTGARDNSVTIEDLLFYLASFDAGTVAADVDDGSFTGTTDGGVTIEDLIYFLFRFEQGC